MLLGNSGFSAELAAKPGSFSRGSVMIIGGVFHRVL